MQRLHKVDEVEGAEGNRRIVHSTKVGPCLDLPPVANALIRIFVRVRNFTVSIGIFRRAASADQFPPPHALQQRVSGNDLHLYLRMYPY